MFEADGGNEVLWIFDRIAALAGALSPRCPARGSSPASAAPATRRASSRSCIPSRPTRKAICTPVRRSAVDASRSSYRRGHVRDNELDVFVPAGNPSELLPHYDPVKDKD